MEKENLLSQACLNGDLIEVLNLLTRKTTNIEEINENLYRPIHFAITNSNVAIVELLISNKCDIEAENDQKMRPIHLACKYGNLDIVQLLISNGCDLSVNDLDGNSPSHLACEFGHLDIIKFLISNGSDLEARNNFSQYLIHNACRFNRIEIAKFLISNNCNLEAPNYKYDRPIHIACEYGFEDICSLLIQQNCDVNAENSYGNRPIHLACINGHLRIIEHLFKVKCDWDSANYWNMRPIEYACKLGVKSIVQLLLDNNCNTNKTIYMEHKEVYHLFYSKKTKRIDRFKMHIGHHKEIESPLYVSCQRGHLDIVELILDARLRNVRNLTNNCHSSAEDMIKCQSLIDDEKERFCTHIACSSGHLNVVQYLLDIGWSDIECEDMSGDRLIHIACLFSHVDIVRFLLDRNCCYDIMNKRYQKPIHMIPSSSYASILPLFLSRNCSFDLSDEYKSINSYKKSEKLEKALRIEKIFYCMENRIFPELEKMIFQYYSQYRSEIIFRLSCYFTGSIQMTKPSNSLKKMCKLICLIDNDNRIVVGKIEIIPEFYNRKLNSQARKYQRTEKICRKMCEICFTNEINYRFPCGHVTCSYCSWNADFCYYCWVPNNGGKFIHQ